MIRAPRSPRTHCACGTCRTCSDPLTQAWAEDSANERAHRAAREAAWRTADLAAGQGGKQVAVGSLAARPALVNPPRRAVWPSLAVFDRQMAALHERVRGDG